MLARGLTSSFLESDCREKWTNLVLPIGIFWNFLLVIFAFQTIFGQFERCRLFVIVGDYFCEVHPEMYGAVTVVG